MTVDGAVTMTFGTRRLFLAFLHELHSSWSWGNESLRWHFYRDALGAMTGEWL